MSQVWDCDYCKCVTRKPGPNCKNLNCSCHPAQNLQQQLEAAKLREVALKEAIDIESQERDAALSALEIAQKYLSESVKAVMWVSGPSHKLALDISEFLAVQDPSAALAERDRETEKRTAERCVAIAAGCYYAEAATGYIRREFKLEPKPEGK